MVVQRNLTFDIMKGIGILLVMLGHVWSVYIPNIHHVIYSFHMPMFFIVAGYFSKSYSHGNNGCIVRGYIKRLIPPFVFTIVIGTLSQLLLGILKSGYGWNPAILGGLSLLYADINPLPTIYGSVNIGVVWFLLALFWAKVWLLLLSRWGKIMLPVSFALSIGALLLHNVFPYSIWCFSIGFVALPFVSIGWWVRRNRVPTWLKIMSVICWILAIGFSEMDFYTYCFPHYPLNVIGACGGTYVFYLLCKGINKVSSNKYLSWLPKTFAYLGTISLVIMCVHNFEIDSHLGNRLRALIGIELPIWGLYIWRYCLTIVLAIVVVHIPKIKRIFV